MAEGAREADDVAFEEPLGGPVGDDERVPVTDPTTSPWRHTCALRITASDGVTLLLGTGWLIAPRVVITAAHCLFVRPKPTSAKHFSGRVSAVEVIPALAGTTRPYGSSRATRFDVPKEWSASLAPPTDNDADFDYGAIFLDGSGFPGAGSFSFGVVPEEILAGQALDIPGYPYHVDGQTDGGTVLNHYPRNGHDSIAVNDLPVDRDGKQLYYSIDTSGGQSGAPVLLDVGGKATVIGIHTTGYRSAGINSARRIDEQLFACLRSWKKGIEHGCHE